MEINIADGMSMVNALAKKVVSVMNNYIERTKDDTYTSASPLPLLTSISTDMIDNDGGTTLDTNCLYTPRKPRGISCADNIPNRNTNATNNTTANTVLGLDHSPVSENTSLGRIQALLQRKIESQNRPCPRNSLVNIPIRQNMMDALNSSTIKSRFNTSFSEMKGESKAKPVTIRSVSFDIDIPVTDTDISPRTNTPISKKSCTTEHSNDDLEFENDLNFLSKCYNKTSTPEASFKKQLSIQTQREISPFVRPPDMPKSLDRRSQNHNSMELLPLSPAQFQPAVNFERCVSPLVSNSTRDSPIVVRTPVRRCLSFGYPNFKTELRNNTSEVSSISNTLFRNEDDEAVYYLITKYLNNKDMKW